MKRLVVWIIKGYKKYISPSLPKSCRYYPTCSTYMIDAIEQHGLILGLIMGTSRIIRCNPFVKGGVEPEDEALTIFRNAHPEKYEDEIISRRFHSKNN